MATKKKAKVSPKAAPSKERDMGILPKAAKPGDTILVNYDKELTRKLFPHNATAAFISGEIPGVIQTIGRRAGTSSVKLFTDTPEGVVISFRKGVDMVYDLAVSSLKISPLSAEDLKAS